MPGWTRPQVSRVLRELLPKRQWTREDLWRWVRDTQERNARAKRSHAKRRQLRDPPDTAVNSITQHPSL